MKTLLPYGFSLVLLCSAGLANAADAPAATLAEILSGMNHFPSEEQKQTLSRIAEDDSVDEDLRVIARAISGIEHSASDASEQKLQEIVNDPEATEAEKTLAGAVIRFNHKVAGEDSADLAALSQ